jgi:hypothetical protein
VVTTSVSLPEDKNLTIQFGDYDFVSYVVTSTEEIVDIGHFLCNFFAAEKLRIVNNMLDEDGVFYMAAYLFSDKNARRVWDSDTERDTSSINFDFDDDIPYLVSDSDSNSDDDLPCLVYDSESDSEIDSDPDMRVLCDSSDSEMMWT